MIIRDLYLKKIQPFLNKFDMSRDVTKLILLAKKPSSSFFTRRRLFYF